MNVSPNGLAMIKTFEGFSAIPYKDAAGYNTIGFGHKLQQGELCDSITEAEATELLLQDVQTAESAVNQCVNVPLNQNQYDALVSFTYNLGGAALLKSTLLELLNNGEYWDAAQEFTKWDHVKGREMQGLLKRRAAEKLLFQTPVA